MGVLRLQECIEYMHKCTTCMGLPLQYHTYQKLTFAASIESRSMSPRGDCVYGKAITCQRLQWQICRVSTPLKVIMTSGTRHAVHANGTCIAFILHSEIPDLLENSFEDDYGIPSNCHPIGFRRERRYFNTMVHTVMVSSMHNQRLWLSPTWTTQQWDGTTTCLDTCACPHPFCGTPSSSGGWDSSLSLVIMALLFHMQSDLFTWYFS